MNRHRLDPGLLGEVYKLVCCAALMYTQMAMMVVLAGGSMPIRLLLREEGPQRPTSNTGIGRRGSEATLAQGTKTISCGFVVWSLRMFTESSVDLPVGKLRRLLVYRVS